MFVITRILQKQVGKELEIIYENLYSFVKEFFGEDTAEFIEDLEFTTTLGDGYLLVKQYWIDEDGNQCHLELDIDCGDYNEWFKGLNLKD